MESSISKFSNVRTTVLLLCFYFGGYLFLFPKITSYLTFQFDPMAIRIAYPFLIITYAVTMLGVFWIGKPFLKGQWAMFYLHRKEHMMRIFYCFCCIVIMNLLCSLLVSLLTSSDVRNHQASTFVGAIVIAPILEEIVFRGGLFSSLRARFPFFISLIISSVLFGSIHIIDSLKNGSILDVSYLLVYSVIGLVLGYSYEKSGSLIVPISVHMLNNILAFFVLMM